MAEPVEVHRRIDLRRGTRQRQRALLFRLRPRLSIAAQEQAGAARLAGRQRSIPSADCAIMRLRAKPAQARDLLIYPRPANITAVAAVEVPWQQVRGGAQDCTRQVPDEADAQ
jgi:hypothetical protein